jgi:hypothetical protein
MLIFVLPRVHAGAESAVVQRWQKGFGGPLGETG